MDDKAIKLIDENLLTKFANNCQTSELNVWIVHKVSH